MTNNPPTHDDAESEAERVVTPPDFSSAPEGATVQAWQGRHYLVLRSGEYCEWGLLSPISRPLVERALSHERQLREEAERRVQAFAEVGERFLVMTINGRLCQEDECCKYCEPIWKDLRALLDSTPS